MWDQNDKEERKMAYTYDDFVNAATAGGRLNSFSEADLEITKKNPEYGLSMLRLMDDADNATTEEAKLLTQSAMDQLRSTYGGTTPTYAGTYDGNVDALLGQAAGYGSFAYGGETEYQKLLDEVMNHQPFSYDAATDPSYQALRKTYLREGDRATENALAKASAATGGTPSSYAVTAATQAGNYHAAQLADRLPGLEQQAYQKYLQDFALKKDKLATLASDREQEYKEWLQGYDMLNQNLGNYQGAAATEWQRYLDEAELKRQEEYAKQNAASTEESLKQQRYENALALYKILGYATPEIAAILGIPEGAPATTEPVNPPKEPEEPEGPDTPTAEEQREQEIKDWVTTYILDKMEPDEVLNLGYNPNGFDPVATINGSSEFSTPEEREYALEVLRNSGRFTEYQFSGKPESNGSGEQGGAKSPDVTVTFPSDDSGVDYSALDTFFGVRLTEDDLMELENAGAISSYLSGDEIHFEIKDQNKLAEYKNMMTSTEKQKFTDLEVAKAEETAAFEAEYKAYSALELAKWNYEKIHANYEEQIVNVDFLEAQKLLEEVQLAKQDVENAQAAYSQAQTTARKAEAHRKAMESEYDDWMTTYGKSWR